MTPPMPRAAAAAVLLLAATANAQDKQDKPDAAALKRLEGAYAVRQASAGGVELPADALAAATARIAADELVVTVRDKANPAKITRLAPPGAGPAAIDVAPADGPEKGKTFPGIYTLADGELTLALAEKGDRPKDFAPAPGVLLLKLRRQPPKGGP